MARPTSSLVDTLDQKVLVLDGGLSNQLEDQGCDLSDELWSARLLIDDPRQTEAAHAAYIRAGARVIITGCYQASFEGFARRGIGRAEARELFGRSVEPARSVAGERDVWVAASIGPYGAVLADGSEYRGRYGMSTADLERFHRPRVEALVAAEPDVLALETVPDLQEAEALLRAVDGCGVPVRLSYTIAGDRTCAGQPLAEAFSVAAGNEQVIAVGVNCCAAEDVEHAVAVAVSETGKPAVAYPNGGETWDAARRTWRGRPAFDPSWVDGWRAAGARLIGGCCRVGPERIAELAAMFGA